MPRHTRLVLSAILVAAPFVHAQAPVPAPELKQLQPLVGSWEGKGEFFEPDPATGQLKATKWSAVGTYATALGGFWLREDFAITFEGMPTPMHQIGYLGWDGERKTFVKVDANSGGQVTLGDLLLLPDGSHLQMTLEHQGGSVYAQRSVMKVDGDRLQHDIDLLLPMGKSVSIVAGEFRRSAKAIEVPMPKARFGPGETPAAMRKLGTWVGTYAVAGQMVMMPGTPAMQITGTDRYESLYGGALLQAFTEGTAEGMPGKYEAVSLFGWDDHKGCLKTVMVSNMGESGSSDWHPTEDGKGLIGTIAGKYMGKPMLARSVLTLDDKGQPKAMRSDTLFGDAPAFESFRCTYTKQ